MGDSISRNPVFMFSGQGSQKPGMGLSLLNAPSVSEVFECASDVFGFDVAKRIETASPEELNNTLNAQATLATLSIAIAQALKTAGIVPSNLLGFSLGQISALPSAGFLSIEDTFGVIRVRASAMARVAEENPGAMCVLLGADHESAQEACAQCAQDDVLVAANYNCPGQIVVSGSIAAIERVEVYWKDQKKRAMRMATSGAFHSPLMESAAVELGEYLDTVAFEQPHTPLVSNLDAQYLNAEDIKDHLVRHLTHSVLFEQSIDMLVSAGQTTFVELGFGGVLVGLVRRINKDLVRHDIEDKDGFDAFCQAYLA